MESKLDGCSITKQLLRTCMYHIIKSNMPTEYNSQQAETCSGTGLAYQQGRMFWGSFRGMSLQGGEIYICTWIIRT